jgi:ribosomal protein S11
MDGRILLDTSAAKGAPKSAQAAVKRAADYAAKGWWEMKAWLAVVSIFFAACSALSFCGWFLTSTVAESAIHELVAIGLLISSGVFSNAVLLTLLVAHVSLKK